MVPRRLYVSHMSKREIEVMNSDKETLTTMADLARVAGVSKITVSRALSNHPLVKPETRERIRKLAADCGYRLNVAARNLRLQRTHTIAVIVEMSASPTRPMSEPYPLALLGGIMQELTSASYNLVLTTAETFGRTAPSADGVILLGQGWHEEAVAPVAAFQLPLVVWGAVREGQSYVAVGSDNWAGGTIAAERLLAMGRRNLVFLGDTEYAEMEDRYGGFCQDLEGSDAKLLAQRSCAFTFAGGHDAMLALIDEFGDAIDGVFACSDLIAMGAARALVERSRRIPEQVSVIGFDDSPTSAFFVPALTSIRQDWNEAGRLLARKALSLVEGELAVSEKLSTHLIIRSS
jgi:DNA-binding LacI/PurR family transcriptional regulator